MKKVICIQGLGFVGSAMAVACAMAGIRNGDSPIYEVIGLDLPTSTGLDRIEKINNGKFPFKTSDLNLIEQTYKCHKAGNLKATTDVSAIDKSDIVVVDIHFDVGDLEGEGSLNFKPFESAIESIGERIKPGALVLIETTVPPGTCAKIVRPILTKHELRRGLPSGSIKLAHSYERVMPGEDYLTSIVDFWRVFSGETKEASDLCRSFLENIINTKSFPLTELSNTTASETAKVLENSYRATNIAFIEEWGKYSELVGIDLFEILNAIRVRPTHSNIKQPGFGVGGYCLTKDPLFALLSGKVLFNLPNIEFPFSTAAVKANQRMPLHSLSKVRNGLGGSLDGKKILLAGITYRQNVADSRYSPSEIFYRAAIKEGATIVCSDPLLDYWEELDVKIEPILAKAAKSNGEIHAIIFAVPHTEYFEIIPEEIIGSNYPYLLDANNCLSKKAMKEFGGLGCHVESIGRG